MQPTEQQQVIITQIKQPEGNDFPYAVTVAVGDTFYLSRLAVTQEHAALLAERFAKEYPGAVMVWR